MTVSFSNLGIQCVKKKDIEDALKVREEIRVDPFRSKWKCGLWSCFTILKFSSWFQSQVKSVRDRSKRSPTLLSSVSWRWSRQIHPSLETSRLRSNLRQKSNVRSHHLQAEWLHLASFGRPRNYPAVRKGNQRGYCGAVLRGTQWRAGLASVWRFSAKRCSQAGGDCIQNSAIPKKSTRGTSQSELNFYI